MINYKLLTSSRGNNTVQRGCYSSWIQGNIQNIDTSHYTVEETIQFRRAPIAVGYRGIYSIYVEHYTVGWSVEFFFDRTEQVK